MKKQKGITLIALIITIIVLLILAGITITAILGDNGILSKSNASKIKTIDGKILEAMKIQANEYCLAREADNEETTFIKYLQDKGILSEEKDGGYEVNVVKLLGNAEAIGNGSNKNDVYFLEITDEDLIYNLAYYENASEKRDLDDFKDWIDDVNGNDDDNNPSIPLYDYQIIIKTISEDYNSTLGSFPVVYSVVGKIGTEVVYEDIAYTEVNAPEAASSIELNTTLPEGVTITVTESYCSSSYDLTSNNNLEVTTNKDDTTLDFSFLHRYNGGNRGSSADYENLNYLLELSTFSLNTNYKVVPLYSGGGGTVSLAPSIQLHQNIYENNMEQVYVENTSENDAYVRIKIFVLPTATYLIQDIESSLWVKGENNFYYYSAVLPGSESTELINIKVNHPSSLKAIVVGECTPVIYDESGNPYADWNAKYSN